MRASKRTIQTDYALDLLQLEQEDFSAFFASQVLHSLPSLQVLHSVLALSAFLAEQPQPPQAKAEEPAINNAIAAILIILVMS